MTTNEVEVLAVTRPALDRYLARLAEHDRYTREQDRLSACRCGWAPPYPQGSKSANRSLGQHVRYAHRDAERAWKAETNQLLKEYYR